MLKDFIAQSGKAPVAWAKDLGITRSYLSLLTTGRKKPSLDLAFKIEQQTGGAVPAQSWVQDALDMPDPQSCAGTEGAA